MSLLSQCFLSCIIFDFRNRHPNKHEGDNGIDDESSALDSFDFLQRESADEVIDTRISYDSRKDDEVIDLNDEAPRIRKSTQGLFDRI